MTDLRIIAVVRRLLRCAQDSDRAAFINWVTHYAKRQLRHDPRSAHAAEPHAARDIGVDVGSKRVEPVDDARATIQVPRLHSLLLYRTAHLGAPKRLHEVVLETSDLAVFEESRRFLLGLDDLELYIALCSGVRTEVGQLAYRDLDDDGFHRFKQNLENLVYRSRDLTLVVAGKKRYIAHSAHFRGAPRVDADDLGALHGRVLSSSEIAQFTSGPSLAVETFGARLVSWLAGDELLLVPLDALAGAQLRYHKSQAAREALWAGPTDPGGRAAWGVADLSLLRARISRRIPDAVDFELSRYHPHHPKATPERIRLWRQVAIERLRDFFGLDLLEDRPLGWEGTLDVGLTAMGVRRSRDDHRRVVDQLYRKALARVRDGLE